MPCLILRDVPSIRRHASLLRKLPAPTPFSGWGVIERWLGSDERPDEPFLIAVTNASGELIALAPWMRTRNEAGLRKITAIGGEDAWYHDPWIIQPGHDREVASQLVEALRKAGRDWDLLSLILRPAVSGALLQSMERLGWSFEERISWRQQPLVAWEEDWQTYWSARPNSLQELTIRQRRMVSRVPHRYFTVSGREGLELLDPLCRQQASNLPGARDWATFHAYMRWVGQAALEAGTGFYHVLEIEGRLAAMQLQSRHGDRVFGLLRSYDTDLKRYSPGSLLSAWSFEELHREGVRRVDMGPGHYAWKQMVQTSETETLQVQISSPSSPLGMGVVGMAGLLIPHLKNNRFARKIWQRLHALNENTRPSTSH